MKVKDLISKLSKFDPETEVTVQSQEAAYTSIGEPYTYMTWIYEFSIEHVKRAKIIRLGSE